MAAILLAAIAATLASCGRKGALEPDPTSPTASAPVSNEEDTDGQSPRPKPGQPRPFPLDPML
jgi:predicted small lipoprotein YifL